MAYFYILNLEMWRYNDLSKNGGHATENNANQDLLRRDPAYQFFHIVIPKKDIRTIQSLNPDKQPHNSQTLQFFLCKENSHNFDSLDIFETQRVSHITLYSSWETNETDG